MVAEQTISVSGDFYEEMEMKNYPFDTQPLKIGRFCFNKARGGTPSNAGSLGISERTVYERLRPSAASCVRCTHTPLGLSLAVFALLFVFYNLILKNLITNTIDGMYADVLRLILTMSQLYC